MQVEVPLKVLDQFDKFAAEKMLRFLVAHDLEGKLDFQSYLITCNLKSPERSPHQAGAVFSSAGVRKSILFNSRLEYHITQIMNHYIIKYWIRGVM